MTEHAWAALVAAHERVRSTGVAPLAPHAPSAAILACADARVPPSVVFDQPAGSLFVVRIAGNSATPEALASLDYAVEVLGVELIVVLGHTACGAVEAAASGVCAGHLAPIVAPICLLARANPGASVDRLVELNVDRTVEALIAHDGPTGRAAADGSRIVRGAVHDLSTGALVERPDPCTRSRILMETR